jgi:diguanylate cyclase (GGDEF)-like protein
MWRTLRRDPIIVIGAATLLAVVLPYFLPFFSPDGLWDYASSYATIPLLLLSMAAFQVGIRRLAAPERRFWNLWTLGFLAWLVEQVVTSVPGLREGPWLDVLPDALYVLFYLSIILALQIDLHPRPDQSEGRLLRLLESAGTNVFAVGLLVYFVVIPVALDRELFATFAPSLVLCVVLDALVVLRLFSRRQTATEPRLRVVYTWLLATAILWLVTDSAETLMMGRIIPWAPPGTLPDLFWFMPFVTVVVAARARECSFPSAASPEPSGAEAGEPSVVQGLWGDPLVLYAAALPVLHFLLKSFGVMDPVTGPAREVFALVLLVILAGIAIVYQKLLIVEGRRMEEVRLRAARAERRAYHDALTGLPNRYLLMDRLQQALPRARRAQSKVSVLFIDLDRFKVINDSLGHTTGDSILEAMASRLQRYVRRGDTLARFGGDEFLVLTEGIHHAGDAATVAQKLQEVIKEPLSIEGRELFLTASVGISLFPDDSADAETLIKNADAAMYRVKELGRDGYQLYTAAMNDQALDRLQMENGLRRALSLDQFRIQYQPIVDVAGGGVSGCEALLRWLHPTKGLLLPDQFIELAELTGMIKAVGAWVLEQACVCAQGWQEPGREPLSVAVNISARQFREPGLVGEVERALAQAGLSPGLLELEITESLAMHNAESTIDTLRALKRLGVRISIDDFGTGYSSLSYLRQFPIDVLKIDRSFVNDVDGNPEVGTLVSTVIAMGRTLGLGVVAEGVEREGQLSVLRRLECERAQGFLFSPPVPQGELAAFLRRGTGASAIPSDRSQ